MSNWLVTGGAGFIGSNIVEVLVHRNENVRVLDNLSTGLKKNLKSISGKFEIIIGDVRDMKTCRNAVKNMDYVLHQAALGSIPRSIDNPSNTHSSNVTGTLNMLIASKDEGVKRFVCAGSSSVYGNNPKLPRNEDMTPMPISPYAVSKLAQEHYCMAFHYCYKLETVILRYFNVYGPRQNPNSQYAAVIPRFMKAVLIGQSPEIYGDGKQTRDFTYVEDCVNANLIAAKAKLRKYRVFNIARGKYISINQLYNIISKISHNILKAKYTKAKSGEMRHSLADISKAVAIMKWRPKIDIKDGILLTYNFMKNIND